MQQMSSAITGILDRVERQQNSTGRQLSGTGSATSVTESAARQALVQRRPVDTDRNLLRWLESSLNVVAKPEKRTMFPKEGGFYSVTMGFSFSGLTEANRFEAEAAVESSMTRPTLDQCEDWIASLHAVTARRSDDEAALGLAMTLYASRLSQYPADIAKEACMAFALRRQKPNWFPTLSELDEWCEKQASMRSVLLAKIKSFTPSQQAA